MLHATVTVAYALLEYTEHEDGYNDYEMIVQKVSAWSPSQATGNRLTADAHKEANYKPAFTPTVNFNTSVVITVIILYMVQLKL